ncbi:hypothetical protein [Flavobacterium akiainvivens]|uniref:hypothetical protein n=1 Tax=Flavobacterium akiainvivens TaxID=1202724 RepID=UPI0006C84843|nr:hypothetical protein [Flavobacterium akiainvivens]SFQ50120.1 hypothetical protein SAMN05444144_10647 [Flavobacterium akiainvivens]
MKKYILFIMLFTALGAWAQPEKRTTGISIPKATPDVAVQPSQTTVAPNPERKINYQPEEKKMFEYPAYTPLQKKGETSIMTDNERFASRADDYQKRTEVKPRGESNEAYRGNQFFGEVRSKSKYVQIMARDFEYVDGDRIKVLVNDVTVVDEITLTSDFKGITLTLKDGFNKIDFEALNQGTSGPNTAEFRIYDDKETQITGNQWNLATGFKASIIIVKEVDGNMTQQGATQTPPSSSTSSDTSQGN